MKKILKVFSLLAVLLFLQSVSLSSQTIEPPKLIVGIFVDGLQAEHVKKMERYFTPDGFRLFNSSGIVINEVEHPILPNGKAADIATIMSGTFPAAHGVIGDYIFDKKKIQKESVLFDENYSGIGNKRNFSAHKLMSSTITDELAMNNQYSKIHVIGIDPETVIMLAGHAATSATWIDENNKKWVTTSYYNKGLTPAADAMNFNGDFKRIVSQKWTPSASISSFKNPTADGSKTVPFLYNSNKDKHILSRTPIANELVSELASNLLLKENLGNDQNTDFLALQYTVVPPKETTSKLRTAEQEDMYIRLDRNLQKLVYQIKKKVGEQNVFFFMIGSSLDSHTPIELGNHKIPSGYFNAERSQALLNTYLMALYGNDKWILGYYNKQFYLNNDLISQKNLDKQKLITDISEFLGEFEGVDATYSKNQILNFSERDFSYNKMIKNTYHALIGGDIVLKLKPGWQEIDKNGNLLGESKKNMRTFPLYILGIPTNTNDFKIKNKVESIDIAPTIADMLKISNPNATIGSTIFYKSE